MGDAIWELVHLTVAAVIAFVLLMVVGYFGNLLGIPLLDTGTFIHVTLPFGMMVGTLVVYIIGLMKRKANKRVDQ